MTCEHNTDNPGDLEVARVSGFRDGIHAVERKYAEAAARLSDAAAYKIARMAGSVHPCEVDGCSLSQEEHHRLAYGILAENRELKRRIQELEHGPKEVPSPEA